MSHAIVLFAHGARDPRWAEPFQRLQALVAQRCPQQRVELAFLELMSPSLPEQVASLIAAGCQQISIVPAFMAQGGHLRRDLPALINELIARYPYCAIRSTPPLGEVETVLAAMADWIASAADEDAR